ncbi:MAG TPA: prevent-host-death protein [Coriobacteriia bacterium]|nr:prevent-host-death protein [Coriobacteriia bacterium]
MTTVNVTNFRKNIFALLEQTVKYNEPVNISTKDGTAVVLSEEDYNGMMETIYLSSVPQVKNQILSGMNESLSEAISEDEVDW